MARLTGLLAAAAIVGSTVTSVSAQTPVARPAVFTPVFQAQQARLSLGSIRGLVSDERGGPLAGALVSALGATYAMATTDARGRFLIQPLAVGDYVLRVHLVGFVSGRREGVRVGPTTVDVAKIQMHRLDDAAAPLSARPILTAGVSLPSGENPTAEGENHSETAWRLRHIKRSVLKQDGDVVSIADAAREAGGAQPIQSGTSSIFGRAFDNAANMAASFFTATPFSGEVNFLTTSALGTGPLLFSDFVPRGVAYMSIGAPAASGRWDVRASMSQSDVSAAASVAVDQSENALLIPREAVDTKDGKSFVRVKSGDRYDTREVKLGMSDNIHVAVLSGLHAGDEVAVDRPQVLLAAN